MVRVVASTAGSSADIVLEEGDGQNAVVVKQAEELTITAPAAITVQLPAFAGREVFVKHEAESGVYFYKATAGGDGTLTFTSRHGFSPFTFSLNNEAAAEIGEVGYDTLQAAVNAAGEGSTITILSGGTAEELTASVSGSSRTFTLVNNTGEAITVTLNGTALTIADGESEAYAYTRPTGTLSAFEDVASGSWYYDAVNWAAAQNIVTGYGDGTFGPEEDITREQMAAILYRYAQYKEYISVEKGDLSAFTDGDTVSDWAQTAMEWAVGNGVLSGKGNNLLDPTGTASRAEVAQILMNFCNAFVK